MCTLRFDREPCDSILHVAQCQFLDDFMAAWWFSEMFSWSIAKVAFWNDKCKSGVALDTRAVHNRAQASVNETHNSYY